LYDKTGRTDDKAREEAEALRAAVAAAEDRHRREVMLLGTEHGKLVQVERMKPRLKAPGTQRFNLKYEKLLSILLQFCFQIQLAPLKHGNAYAALRRQLAAAERRVADLEPALEAAEAGAYSRPFFSST
jgi:hypothetical protein